MKTMIHYYLPETTLKASISVTNTEGKVLGMFQLDKKGDAFLEILSGTLAPGTLYYSLIADNHIIDTKKMILVK